ncbi:hypothetical protein SHKM778_05330 [Streptomyces sp. KM77-8]|uniref:histidine kinase n=1 Tax=Streptomyces haneummycinicus TaxID=3074435 RepID=A0AAT9H9Q4_9ACTN
MHDSLGHELSLLALRAAALQVAPGLPVHHRSAAADLRAAAADATDRLHRIIGVLREDDEPLPLAPAGENVEQLVARAAESGLPVRWETGARRTDLASGGVAERLLHRVTREALTNAARHAPGAPVVVTVTGDKRQGVAVTISNGRPADRSSPPPAEVPDCRDCAPPLPRSAAPSRRARTPTGSASGRTSPRGRPRHSNRPAPPPPLHPRPPPRRRRPRCRRRRGRRPRRRRLRLVRVHRDALGAGTRRLRRTAPGHTGHGGRAGTAGPAGPGPADGTRPAPPEDTDCRYYRASGELFVSVDHFRLCFDDEGRLAAKDVIPRAGLSGEGRAEYEEFAP